MHNIVTLLEKEVRRTLIESGYKPSTNPKTLIVAVSGGTDSLALLYALSNLQNTLGLAIHCAHLNHGLRGKDSDQDSHLVSTTSQKLNINFTSKNTDILSYRTKHHLSLEQAARQVRYEFLSQLARTLDTNAIALGHTKDDQVETILMHIIRGSGLTGLRGMEQFTERTISGEKMLLIRPLLNLTRKNTTAYCKALNLKPRLDQSNESIAFLRNRVRLKLLPTLESYNPAIRGALLRLSHSASKDLEYISNQLSKVWPKIVRQEQGQITIDKPMFQTLQPAIRSHLLRRAIQLVKGGLEEIEQVHIDDMDRLINGASGRTLCLPCNVKLVTEYTKALIIRGDTKLPDLPTIETDHILEVPGETTIKCWHVKATILQSTPYFTSIGFQLPNKRPYAPYGMVAHLDSALLDGNLWVRNRRPGDRFHPLGMETSKKLQDFMVDTKISRHWRSVLPLVVSKKGIAWVTGWRIAEWAKVNKNTQEILRLEFKQK